MRSFKALVAAGALVVALPSLAHAQWYVGADVGGNITSDAPVRIYDATNDVDAFNDTTYNWGPVGLIEAGYSFGGPKVEMELGYRTNRTNMVGAGTGAGSTNSFSMMTNAIYELQGIAGYSKVHPFVGAGLGAAKIMSNDITSDSVWAYSGSDWKMAYQGMAGVGYDITDNLMVKGQYRYFATENYVVSGISGDSGHAEYKNQAVLVGLTYSFGSHAPSQAAAPAPVAFTQSAYAPAPTSVPAARRSAAQNNYIVFFDFDKASLSAEADRVISQAAVAAKLGGITRVNLTGHTDLSGSDKYNVALSLKRANVVKEALVKQGVPAGDIVLVGKGKSSPLVKTKDGVREPQNRRVEIVLQ